MSLNKIILEALERNPVALKESLSSILSEKIANAIDKRMNESANVLDKHSVKEDLDESVKDGYYVSNSMKVIHDKPFKDSKSAIRHADTHETKTGRVHHVTKVKDGKVEKQWAYNGGHHEGGWEHYSDYKGDDASSHLVGLHKNSIKEDLDENTEMKGDHLISAKLIHKDLKNIDSLSPDTQKILKRHEKQMITKYGEDWRKKAGINEGVGLKYKPWHRDEWKAQASHMGLTIKPATDLEGNSGNLIIAKDKFGNTKGQFHHKTGGFLDESEQLDEVISKTERRNLAYHEKQAVRAAEKANVGALPRSDKEKWIDDYIAKNFIPKGAVGSAVYSGVMKVRPTKVEK